MKKYDLTPDHRILYERIVSENVAALRNGLSKYTDPDRFIVQTVNIGGEDISLAPDGICGISYLQKYFNPDELADAYALSREKIIMWPKHSQGINQRRYACFRDRLDFTIFDVKMFFQTGESRLVIKGSLTEIFMKNLGSFDAFIEEYELEAFVRDGEVINLATGDVITGYDDYRFSKKSNRKYIQGLFSALRRE